MRPYLLQLELFVTFLPSCQHPRVWFLVEVQQRTHIKPGSHPGVLVSRAER
jgi:hypothetical protein